MKLYEHTRPQLLILQNIKRSELPRIHALHAQDLDAGATVPALRRLWGALHEEDDGGGGHGFVDGGARFGRDEAGLEEGEPGDGGAGGEGAAESLVELAWATIRGEGGSTDWKAGLRIMVAMGWW